MKKNELLTLHSHPKWRAAETKLAEIETEASKLRQREGALAELIVSAGTQGTQTSLAAMQLIGGVVAVPNSDMLASIAEARGELKTLRDRLAVLSQASAMLRQRMFHGTDDTCSLVGELAAECCRLAGPAYLEQMRSVQAAAEKLRDELVVAQVFIDTLERGGASVSDPIRREFGPFLGIGNPDNNQMRFWLEAMHQYFNEMKQVADAA